MITESVNRERLRKRLRKEPDRATKAEALRRWGEAEEQAKMLIEQFRNEAECWKRDIIGTELAELGPPAAIILDDLIHLLSHKDRYVRREAAWILGAIGPDAKEATGQLGFVKNNDKEWIVRRAAGRALLRIHRDRRV